MIKMKNVWIKSGFCAIWNWEDQKIYVDIKICFEITSERWLVKIKEISLYYYKIWLQIQFCNYIESLKVKKMSISKAAVFKILPRDINSVLSSVLRPSEVLTILKSLETLIILRAVGLKFNFSSNSSSNAIKDIITMMKSNLFQLTYQ